LEADKAALIVDEKTYAQQLDLLRFQVNEIKAAKFDPTEEEDVNAEYQRASNAARLLELSRSALGLLSEEEHSVLSQTAALGRTLQDLQRIDSGAKGMVEVQEKLTEVLRELQGEVSAYAERLDLDPARLQQLEERINLIHALKRKYGATLAEVIAFGEETARKLASLEGRDAELARINSALEKINSELWRAGKELSAKRRKLIPQLSQAVVKELKVLGFKQSQFDIALSSLVPQQPTISATGLDSIEFQFAPNPGEPARPLRAIASSGEMARVMLALKTVLAAVDQVPVLIFDEVDANIGGETATAVGEKMQQIARKRQVLCITHLPQVAAHGSAHYVVSKQVNTGRTYSEITLVEGAQRVTELARMLGGQTEAARKHAEALLKK
jgi:DNA repair protein RecN (Recombination protein N)